MAYKLHKDLSGAELHPPKSHGHLEADITDLDHDALKIKGKEVDDSGIGDNKVLIYKSLSGKIEYAPQAGGAAHQALQVVGATVSPRTDSITYVDMPEMSIAITTENKPVLILFTASWRGERTTDSGFVAINIDGIVEDVTQRGQVWVKVWKDFAVAISYLKTLSAGVHTIKVQYKVNSGWVEMSETMRCLQVIELKR